MKEVPNDGALAYKQGILAGDCPYAEGTIAYETWNDDWDRAADEAITKPQAVNKIGSVVTNRYRATYSEFGHPTHCGDELAVLLNNLCLNKAGVNIEFFEAICRANDVNLARYDRTHKGWQGRLRMTGRNLLAKRVRENGGYLRMPDGDDYKLSQEWMLQAEQKYKPKVHAAP